MCSKINAVLKSFFERRNSLLAEVTCHFGKSEDKIFLVDDFTPASLKVLPLNQNDRYPDPYKFGTSAEIKQYTDHLFNLMSS
jgi:phosphoribosylaminoimidazole-succinocarboxamide synthase